MRLASPLLLAFCIGHAAKDSIALYGFESLSVVLGLISTGLVWGTGQYLLTAWKITPSQGFAMFCGIGFITGIAIVLKTALVTNIDSWFGITYAAYAFLYTANAYADAGIIRGWSPGSIIAFGSWGLVGFGGAGSLAFWDPSLFSTVLGLVSVELVRFVWLRQKVGLDISKQLFKQYFRARYFIATTYIGTVGFFLLVQLSEWLLLPGAFVALRYGTREIPWQSFLTKPIVTVVTAQLTQHPNNTFTYPWLKKKTRQYTVFVGFLMGLVIWFSDQIIVVLYGRALSESAIIFALMSISAIAKMTFFQTILQASGHDKAVYQISVIELVVQLCLGITLGYHWGAIGIAGALVLALFTEKILLIAYCYQKKIAWQAFTPINTLMLTGLGLGLLFWWRWM